MSSSQTSLSSPHGHSAFELLVALLLLSVGLLATAGSALALQRLIGASRAAQMAAVAASSRVDLAWSTRCAGPGAGLASTSGVHEQWSLTRTDSLSMLLTDSVSFAAPQRGHAVSESYRSLLPC